ncbi:MAG: NADH-quinone oxidoreductase subunit J [Labilithrix sp.]|nr:NADH-quinone oxidoreductase subunit J [Labilithrix sp.]MCW5834524.1 NADH-quinone oxidoreductase subunit J [Labilithrix sp.]
MSAIGYVYFYACALFAVLGALGTVGAKNPIRGAMGLLLMILSIAGLFLALHAQFLAAIQLIVYAGAIVVLFLFVIMLLGPSASTPSDHRGRIPRLIGAGLFGATGLGAMALLVSSSPKSTIGPTGYPSPTGDFGSVDAFGRIIFSQGLVPFELSSALLMVAIVGAVAVARGRHKSDPAISGAATLEAENVPHAGQAPRTAGGITREAP